MSLTFARLRLCRICILKVTRERFLVKTAALKAAAGVPTDDFPRGFDLGCPVQLTAADNGVWERWRRGGEGLMDKLGKARMLFSTKS